MENQEKAKKKVDFASAWQAIVHFFDRRKHGVKGNIKFACGILVILFVVGLFLPLFGMSFGVNLRYNASFTDVQIVEEELFSTSTDFFGLNLGDMALQKQLGDYAILGQKLNSIEIFGVNVYDCLKSPFPDFSGLKDVSDTSKEAIGFLKSDDFSEISDTIFGEDSDSIKELANGVVDVLATGGDALDYVIDVLGQLSVAQAQVKATIESAEKAVNTVDTIVLLLIIYTFAFIIVYFVGKGPKYLSAIALTPVTVIFLFVGIAIIVANIVIANTLQPIQELLSNGIQQYVQTNAEEIYNFSTSFIDWENDYLVFKVTLSAGIGWWLITISLLFINISAYLLPNAKFNSWLEKRKENKSAEISGEIKE